MEGRGRSRFVEEEDVGSQRVHVATSQRVEGLRLVPVEMFENEVVSVAVARGNCANGLEILELLDARRHAGRAVTGARCMARHRGLRSDIMRGRLHHTIRR